MKPTQTVKIDLTLELPAPTLERLTQQCHKGDVSLSQWLEAVILEHLPQYTPAGATG
jgi:hypothetical protein